MKATINKTESKGKIAQNRKEKSFYQQLSLVSLINKNQMKELIVVRFYGKPYASKVYCCLWVHDNETHLSGGANASGYGYHKASQAFEDACLNAGISFNQGIGGVGSSAIEEGLRAIASELGHSETIIINANA